MAIKDITGLWKKKSNQGTIFLSVGPITIGDLRVKLKAAFEGLAPDQKVYLSVFQKENKKTERHPDASLVITFQDGSEPHKQERHEEPPRQAPPEDDIPF